MTPDELESAVMAFLDARSENPTLKPEDFVRAEGENRSEVLGAIAAALRIEDLFQTADDAPRTIGPYEILRELGRGGMGVVFEARRGGDRVALKLLPMGAVQSDRARVRFRREAEILQRLDHAGIVRVRDAGVAPAGAYLVMDLVEGRPLSETPLDPIEGVRVIRDVARALGCAHQQGLIHRDVKPGNILVRSDGKPVLVDFGLASDESHSTLTQSGDLLGTPRYMAPEQVTGEPVGPWTDVYSLGLVLYELLSGRAARDQGSREAMLRAARKGRVGPVRRVQPAIPRALGAIVDRALSRSARHRPGDGHDLAERLDAWIATNADSPTWTDRRPAPFPVWAWAVLLGALGAVFVLPGLLAREMFRGMETADRESQDSELRRAHAAALSAWLQGDHETTLRACSQGLERGFDPELAAIQGVLTGQSPAEPEAQRIFGALRDLHRGDPEALLTACPVGGGLLSRWIRGTLLARAKRWDEAWPELHGVGVALADRALVAGLLAEVHFHRRDWTSATEAARLATARFPERPDPWHILAECAYRQSNFEGALVAIQAFLRLSPEPTFRQRRILPLTLDHLGRHQDARPHLLTLLGESPQDGTLWKTLARGYDRDHQLAEAEAAYKKAVERRPEDLELALLVAHFVSGGDERRCELCRAAYAARPETNDFARAAELVRTVLHTDHGQSENLTRLVLDVTLKLPDVGDVLTDLSALLETYGSEVEPRRRLLWLTREITQRRSDDGR